MLAVLAIAVLGCDIASSATKPCPDSASNPAADSAVKLKMDFHSVPSAMFSAAVAVRQEDRMRLVLVDLVDQSVCWLGTWTTANADGAYVGEDRTVMVVDSEATYVVRKGVTLKGPRQFVRGVLFARQGTETRIIAYIDQRGPSQTFQSVGQFIVDLTAPDQPRQLADTGGFLLGQLDDGRVLFSGGTLPGDPTVALRAMTLDGTITTIATVSPARYSIEFHKNPRPEVTVAVPGADVGFNDVVTVDLASGAQMRTGKTPIVPTEKKGYPSPDEAFVARATNEQPNGIRITTTAGAEVLALHVKTGTGSMSFSGWVRR